MNIWLHLSPFARKVFHEIVLGPQGHSLGVDTVCEYLDDLPYPLIIAAVYFQLYSSPPPNSTNTFRHGLQSQDIYETLTHNASRFTQGS